MKVTLKTYNGVKVELIEAEVDEIIIHVESELTDDRRIAVRERKDKSYNISSWSAIALMPRAANSVDLKIIE